MSRDVLQVVSWNVRFGEDVKEALEHLRRQPPLRAADVLLLQEMDPPGVRLLADALHMHAAYASACVHPRTAREFGNAVLSSAPLHDRRVVHLPHRAPVRGTPRLALGVGVHALGRRVDVWCTHTEVPSLRPARRAEQLAVFARAVAGGAPATVAGGDFNTASRRSVDGLVVRLSQAGTTWLTPGDEPSVRRAGRGFRLDHLFARGLRAVAAGTAPASPASDHRPVWATLVPA